MRPTVAQIRPGALLRNYSILRTEVHARVPGASLLTVVKANAYGHGVERCGPALAGAGAEWLGVTSVEEALFLLRACEGASPRVLVMSGFFPGEEGVVVERGLTPAVWEPWQLVLLHRAAARAGVKRVPVHLEIDTGMSRQGVAPGQALATLLERLRGESPVWIEGVLTHFSSPENADVTRAQMARFAAALEQLREAGARPRWVHAGNSANSRTGSGLEVLAGLAHAIGAELMVRPGLALYGLEPSVGPGELLADAPALEPVMRWVTKVISIREVPEGTPVGYGETYRAGRGGARLALLPVGYADGLRRELSNRGVVLIGGRRMPIAGRVSMDQTVVDVSSLPGIAVGEEAVLLGRQGGEEIGAWEMAGWFGGIAYEVVCGVGERVPRVET